MLTIGTLQVQHVMADTWPQAREYLFGRQRGNVDFFRGQKSCEWALRPTLERPLSADQRAHKSLDLENFIVTSFQRRAHHYFVGADLPNPDDKLAWLALIQHYGGPTRLLDFTLSPMVAAYFAFREPSDHTVVRRAIWIVEAIDFLKAFRTQFTTAEIGTVSRGDAALRIEMDRHIAAHLPEAQLLVRYSQPGVFALLPSRFSDRVTTQQAMFIGVGDTTKAFDENWRLGLEARHERAKHSLRDLEIQVLSVPDCERQSALSELSSMRIDESSLFPGPDGLGRQLSMYVQQAAEHDDRKA